MTREPEHGLTGESAGGDRFTREVVGVAAGYVAIPLLTMIVTVIVTRFVEPGAILVRPDDVEPTRGWLAFSVGLGMVSALVAGVVCALIARTRRASVLLAAIVFTMGLVLAIPLLRAGGAGGADGDASVATIEAAAGETRSAAAAFRAALAARTPTRWMVWKPVVSAVLVLAAARAVSRAS